MRKFLAYAFPVLILVLFIIVMNAGPWLKKPWGDEADFATHLQSLSQWVKQQKWNLAEEEWRDAERDFKRVIARIQFSVERDELNRIDDLMARIKGAIEAKDRNIAVVEINEAHEHWRQLGR